jgi:alpha-beta hydrolase superfamily lysophospholipase
MGAVFRIGINWKAPGGRQRPSLADRRWSLAAQDPTSRLRCGSLEACDRARIPYRLWAAEGNTRALVVLLHGAFDYSAAFDEMGPHLAQRGYTAIAFDQRGFGGTVSRGRWRGKARMVRDVAEVAAFLRGRYGESPPLFVIGESMGAAVAVLATAQYPGLNVAGLVLAAPGALAGMIRRTIVAALLRALRWTAPVGAVVCERLSGRELTAAAAIRLLVDPLILRMVRPNMMFGLGGLAQDAVDEAPAVHVPTLTMAGTKDDFVRIGCMKQLYRRFAGPKEWATFEGGPHLLLHWQHGDRVVARAIDWMERRMQLSTQAQGDGAKTDLRYARISAMTARRPE